MKTLLTSTLLLLALSPLAQAKNHHTVKVVKTVPTHKYQVVKQPKYVQAKTIKVSHKKPNTGVIIGGVVGGLIGHNTSTHQNKVVGTIAGAIIGSALGHQIDKVTDSHHTKVYKKVTHNKRHR